MAASGQNGLKVPNTQVVERNIDALLEHRRAQDAALGWQDRFAGRIARFAGSMAFVGLHLVLYGIWAAINLGVVPSMPIFDPSFVTLAVIASVESLFLSTFILINQNRMQAHADRRADLNLQISLLAEHEITRLMKMVAEIGERMNIVAARSPELSELKQDVKPEHVLDTIDRRESAIDRPKAR